MSATLRRADAARAAANARFATNARVLVTGVISGASAGILGLTGVWGIVAYAVAHVLCVLLIVGVSGASSARGLAKIFPKGLEMGVVDTQQYNLVLQSSSSSSSASSAASAEPFASAVLQLMSAWWSDALLTFLLFWALFYNVVHVF